MKRGEGTAAGQRSLAAGSKPCHEEPRRVGFVGSFRFACHPQRRSVDAGGGSAEGRWFNRLGWVG